MFSQHALCWIVTIFPDHEFQKRSLDKILSKCILVSTWANTFKETLLLGYLQGLEKPDGSHIIAQAYKNYSFFMPRNDMDVQCVVDYLFLWRAAGFYASLIHSCTKPCIMRRSGYHWRHHGKQYLYAGTFVPIWLLVHTLYLGIAHFYLYQSLFIENGVLDPCADTFELLRLNQPILPLNVENRFQNWKWDILHARGFRDAQGHYMACIRFTGQSPDYEEKRLLSQIQIRFEGGKE